VDLREWRRRLRVASAAGVGDSLTLLMAEPPPMECLQEAGTALLSVGVGEGLVVRTVGELRQRGWVGDEALARELEGDVSYRRNGDVRAVPVDLDELGGVLDGPAGAEGGLLDLETGAVWSGELLENSRDAGLDDVPAEADGVRWIEVWPEGHAGRDLRAFIVTVSDPDLRDRLDRSIRAKGAFRRFRGVLEGWPEEASRWHAFNDDRRVGRARAWLAEAGYRAESRPTPPA
jgi:hypothetical protein